MRIKQGTLGGRKRQRSLGGAPRAFTLIELLVVIGIIVILAGMTFPAMQGIKVAQARHRARAELSQVETAIENYKTKLGFYPPDNNPNWTANQLYYELLGTMVTVNGGLTNYQTLDGSATIQGTSAALQAAFGTTTIVAGFMNCAKPGAGDDAPNAVPFLNRIKPAQFLAAQNPVTATVLGLSMRGLPTFTDAGNGEIVPYGYNSSAPHYNTRSFDLWVDIVAGGKTNRISNWSLKPIIVYYTSIATSYP